ncbi:MAG: hypothetical protein NVSMB52_16660 [Chloroflexota bacterium]
MQETRDELELTLCDWAVRDDMPILGICRGIQVLAVAAGGTLIQDVPSEIESATRHEVREHGRDHPAHDIDIREGTLLHTVLGVTRSAVNTFHHQSVSEVPVGFVVSAVSPDGIIEGIESASRAFTLGVQCHPEHIWKTSAPEYAKLFGAFVEAARHPVADIALKAT